MNGYHRLTDKQINAVKDYVTVFRGVRHKLLNKANITTHLRPFFDPGTPINRIYYAVHRVAFKGAHSPENARKKKLEPLPLLSPENDGKPYKSIEDQFKDCLLRGTCVMDELRTCLEETQNLFNSIMESRKSDRDLLKKTAKIREACEEFMKLNMNGRPNIGG